MMMILWWWWSWSWSWCWCNWWWWQWCWWWFSLLPIIWLSDFIKYCILQQTRGKYQALVHHPHSSASQPSMLYKDTRTILTRKYAWKKIGWRAERSVTKSPAGSVHCSLCRIEGWVGHQGIIQAQNITALKYHEGTICGSLLYHEYEAIKLKKCHLILWKYQIKATKKSLGRFFLFSLTIFMLSAFCHASTPANIFIS